MYFFNYLVIVNINMSSGLEHGKLGPKFVLLFCSDLNPESKWLKTKFHFCQEST